MIKTFPSFSKDTSSYFIGLYEKYMSELETLSCILHNVFRRMKRKGYAVAFSDIEGEILYMLLREKRPGIVYEISPMHGCSTNYILAALTKNGVGRVEAFEIISRVGCTKIGDVIKSNLASLCDFTQYFLHVGDVRETLASQMTSLPPDFVFIDSCHEDYFAEFYVKELFLKCQGPIFIQDICYVDPRPEHNSEATFLLSLLNGNFISIGQYENEINTSVDRSRLVARRPHRSSSILIENPLYEKRGINEYFWLMKSRIWKSHLSTKLLYGGHFTFLELTAMQRGEISLAPALLSNMRRTFLDYDPWSQALLLKFVPDMENVIPKDKIFGPEIPLRVGKGDAEGYLCLFGI
jgi:predicted O-methyltransferase YrrM